MRTPLSLSRWLALALCALSPLSACTCQRPENIEAKERLTKPAPPDTHVKAAEEKLDAAALEDKDKLARVSRMEGAEVAARLKSFTFKSKGDLQFAGPDGGGVHSQETTRVEQSDHEDFAVEAVMGDGSEQRLAFVNDVFYLKNNNGKWRMSRDPTGERNQYRTDAMGIWRAFYELLEHALKVEKVGSGKHDGRAVIKYKLTIPNQEGEAVQLGASVPPAPVGPDGGVADEPAADKRKRIGERMQKWRERARPAGGSGELFVDEETGVVLFARLAGALVVGDGPKPSKLTIDIEQSITGVGSAKNIAVPKEAIEEVARKKMPVSPREVFEEEGVVPKLARDAGPSTNGAGSKGKAAKPGELPDEDPE